MNYEEFKIQKAQTPKYRVKYLCLECYECFIQTFVDEEDYENNSKCPECKNTLLEVLSHE